MSDIFLKFGFVLQQYGLNYPFQHYGPLFHRWLPNGEKDAIAIETGNPNIEIQVWFERSGFLDEVWGNLIKFDYKRREVDPKIMGEQAILDAGPVLGRITFRKVSDEVLEAIHDSRIGNENYVAFGKQVFKLIYNSISQLISILRVNYGQYWLQELEGWDSRQMSLGYYCNTLLNLKYSLDKGKSWHEFLPNKPVGYSSVTSIAPNQRTFSNYLTAQDWLEIEKIVNSGYVPSLAAVVLSRSYQLFDQGNLRQAFIEGITALELAISELVRSRIGASKSLVVNAEAFWTLPIRAQLIIVSTIQGGIKSENIELAVKAIETRNRIVHEGWQPTPDNREQLLVLLITISTLISGPTFRFPSADTGNNISMTSEQWDALS